MDSRLREEAFWFREAFRREFDRTIEGLHTLPPALQARVGQDMLLARQLSLDHFHNVEGFLACPEGERLGYVEMMVDLEDRLVDEDNNTAFAFGLFRMWLCAAGREDYDLCGLFAAMLAPFMEMGQEAGFDTLRLHGAPDPSSRH